MNIISIDPSKRCTGIYINNPETFLSIKYKTKDQAVEYLLDLQGRINDLIDFYEIDAGIIEDYQYNFSSTKSITILAEIAGVIKLSFAARRIPLIIMPIKTWKKYAIEKGKRLFKTTKKEKEEYLEYVKVRYGKEVETIDEADAFMMHFALQEIGLKTVNLSDTDKRLRAELKQILGGCNGKKINQV